MRRSRWCVVTVAAIAAAPVVLAAQARPNADTSAVAAPVRTNVPVPDARLLPRDTAAPQAPASASWRPPALVRQGKWAAAGLFAGSVALAVLQREAANGAFDDLRVYCRTGSCAIGPDGRYADAGAEAIYRRVVDGDRAARVWLVASQTAFVGAATLFILDLKGRRGTTNIPYAGMIVTPGRLGVSLPLPR